ncbi:MAG TPA: hypothetical protein VNN19_12325, partial [bacterium]|nr:hypothetical protein [bacterium]
MAEPIRRNATGRRSRSAAVAPGPVTSARAPAPATLSRHELRHADGRRLWIYGELRGRLPDEPAEA